MHVVTADRYVVLICQGIQQVKSDIIHWHQCIIKVHLLPLLFMILPMWYVTTACSTHAHVLANHLMDCMS
jgi:hypothetical protein